MSDPTVTPTGTSAQRSSGQTTRSTTGRQTPTEAHAALQRLFDAAKPSVANRRAGKDAMMQDVQTITRAIAAAPSPAVSAPDLDAIRAEWRTVIRIESPSDAVLVPVGHLATVEAALAAAHAETERLREERADYWSDINSEHYRVARDRDEVRAALAALRALQDDPAAQDVTGTWVDRKRLADALAAAPSETEEGREPYPGFIRERVGTWLDDPRPASADPKGTR